MLSKSSDVIGSILTAPDGKVGPLSDFLFDDAKWQVRWGKVNAGSEMDQRELLVRSSHLGHPNHDSHELPVDLTRSTFATALYRDYGVQPYWQDEGSRGAEPPDSTQTRTPAAMATPQSISPVTHETLGTEPTQGRPERPATVQPAAGTEMRSAQGPVDDRAIAENMPLSAMTPGERAGTITQADMIGDLHSISDTVGYYIDAEGGSVGHIDGFVLDEDTWAVRYLIVDTKNWMPGKKVLIDPRWVDEVDSEQKHLKVGRVKREQIKQAPKFDSSKPIERDYEKQLYEHYQSAPYWEERSTV